METALKNDFGVTIEIPSIDELMSSDDILNFLKDNKKAKNPYDVDFKEMLNAAASVHKSMQEIPNNLEYKRSSAVFALLNKKSNSFQKEIVKSIAAQYFEKVPTEIKNTASKNKLKKVELISINVAFKAVSGHTYTSFLNVLKSQVYNKYGRETIKAVNYLRLSNLVISDTINYALTLDTCKDTVIKVQTENPALFYPSFYLLGFQGLNQYKDLKEKLMKKGLTTKGWKTMCARSKNYNLRAMRRLKLGIFALNNDLKDAWLRNAFLGEWVKSDALMARTDILLREMSLYNGSINKFSPFPIDRNRRYYDFNEIKCVQLQEISDYLIRHPEDKTKSLVQLYKKTQEWHLELRKLKRAPLSKFKEQSIKTYLEDENKYLFEQIEDSWKLQDEGDEMHHCVYSYSNSCVSNNYVVYTVKREATEKLKAERATLGINMTKMTEEGTNKISNEVFKYTFSQMYSHCNASVSDEMHKSAKVLLKELNKPYNEYLATSKKIRSDASSD